MEAAHLVVTPVASLELILEFLPGMEEWIEKHSDKDEVYLESLLLASVFDSLVSSL